MAQHDYDIANASGASVRSDLNNALSAIVSLNSGASAPSTTYADMLWVDTTNGLIKRRNSANSGWLPFGPRSSTMVQAKTGVYTVLPSDFGTLIDCTSGTFDLDLTAAATLGDGFWFMARNSGSGTISIDPNSTENIDGSSTSLTLAAGESVFVFCNGSAFKTIGRSVAAASQAEMETGTSVSVYASPGRQKYHPAHPKAVGYFIGTNTGTFSPAAHSVGVSSIVRNGTGSYNVNLSSPMSSGTYSVNVDVVGSGTGVTVSLRAVPFGSNSGGALVYAAAGTSLFSIATLDPTAGTFRDGNIVMFSVYGDLA
jgi:hypothetical protein